MDVMELLPGALERCGYCGRPIRRPVEAVYVLGERGEPCQWWHMPCRDLFLPVLAGGELCDAVAGVILAELN